MRAFKQIICNNVALTDGSDLVISGRHNGLVHYSQDHSNLSKYKRGFGILIVVVILYAIVMEIKMNQFTE